MWDMGIPLLFTTIRIRPYRVCVYIPRLFKYPPPFGLNILCIKIGFRILFKITFEFRDWFGRRFIRDALGLCEMGCFGG